MKKEADREGRNGIYLDKSSFLIKFVFDLASLSDLYNLNHMNKHLKRVFTSRYNGRSKYTVLNTNNSSWLCTNRWLER